MPAALMQAGVAGVVAGQWPLPDLASMHIMVRFYEVSRRTGCEPAEALRQAQQWVRDTTNERMQLQFPGVLELPGDHVPPEAELLWPTTRAFASPDQWAGFTYTGV